MIAFDNVCFGYSRKRLLYKDLSLNLPNGRIYGLLGKNGAGKSTLLKNIAGTLFPIDGTVTVNGMIPGKRQPSFLETIYYIPEDVYVPSLSINKYLNLFAPFYPKFNNVEFQKHLAELQVDAGSKLNKLSFGQQKKFVIAFALACNTDVLLMDEPTNGLDIPSKSQFRKLIAGIMDENRTIIISTHQVRDLENMIDGVLIIDEGKVLLNASVADIEDRLVFKITDTLPAGTKVLHHEQGLGGIMVVMQNSYGQPSKMDLEKLYIAATEKPAMLAEIFNPQMA